VVAGKVLVHALAVPLGDESGRAIGRRLQRIDDAANANGHGGSETPEAWLKRRVERRLAPFLDLQETIGLVKG
jgi:hypothetical protein